MRDGDTHDRAPDRHIHPVVRLCRRDHHLAAVFKAKRQIGRCGQGGEAGKFRQFPLGDELARGIDQHHAAVAGKTHGIDARLGQGNAAGALERIDEEIGDLHGAVPFRFRRGTWRGKE